MERIDREYAIIYVDKTGETLTSRGQGTPELVGDYYKQRGFLQWNFYLIIAEESIEDVEGISAAERIKAIRACDEYSRKYVMPESEIEEFIKNQFPVLRKKRGKIEMIQAEAFHVAKKMAFDKKATFGDRIDDITLIPSYNREYCIDLCLTCLDDVRRDLINHPELQVIFYSHIQHEISLAEKKFKLFLIEE